MLPNPAIVTVVLWKLPPPEMPTVRLQTSIPAQCHILYIHPIHHVVKLGSTLQPLHSSKLKTPGTYYSPSTCALSHSVGWAACSSFLFLDLELEPNFILDNLRCIHTCVGLEIWSGGSRCGGVPLALIFSDLELEPESMIAALCTDHQAYLI